MEDVVSRDGAEFGTRSLEASSKCDLFNLYLNIGTGSFGEWLFSKKVFEKS